MIVCFCIYVYVCDMNNTTTTANNNNHDYNDDDRIFLKYHATKFRTF